MRVIVQSDDLGITEAVSCGIEKGIRDGVVTCTGLFSNMPAAEFAFRLVKPYSHVCLGEDMNLVAGRPCADPGRIPSLVQEDGRFKTSGMHRAIDAKDGNQDHVIYEECLIEMEAQIKRFMEITGKKPEYLHGHSYSTPAVWKAMSAVGEKYGVPLTKDMMAQYGIVRQKGWYKMPFTMENQLDIDPMESIENDTEFLKNDIGYIGTHCGYVDQEIFKVSTFTMIRSIDLAAVISSRMKQWIKDHHIQLITYRDLLAD